MLPPGHLRALSDCARHCSPRCQINVHRGAALTHPSFTSVLRFTALQARRCWRSREATGKETGGVRTVDLKMAPP